HLRLDERAALKIVDVAIRKISEVRQDRGHELRQRFDAFVFSWVEKLKKDPKTRDAVHRLRDEALDSPALAAYIGGLWGQFRDWLSADLTRRPSAVHDKTAALLGSFGARLEADPEVQQWIDAQIVAAVPPLVEEHRAAIGRFIE